MIALDYHESTKHAFNRFARSPGHLDWATQPDPFRRYAGSPVADLPRAIIAAEVPYAALYGGVWQDVPIDAASIGEFLRCSVGLSAWKQYQTSRWALRVNPSSGNLHPTEAYVIHGGRVCHYRPREHALEERAALDQAAWAAFSRNQQGFLVGLTSILWREAWKYGERAFRYCQHDLGHALAALRLSAARLGWTLTVLPGWRDAQIAAVLGIDRDQDYSDAEREEAECLAVVTSGNVESWRTASPDGLVASARVAAWSGTANQLSRSHVEWPAIDDVARATRKREVESREPRTPNPESRRETPATDVTGVAGPRAREVILRRRSAVAFDGRSSLPRAAFASMLARLHGTAPPWDAVDWPARVHLALFVHRVEGLHPGVYAYLRDPDVRAEWQAAMRPECLWEPMSFDPAVADRLYLLLPADVTWPATRVSCDQDIAGDGFFSLGMIARVEASLRDQGEWAYRELFWECGIIGQLLYLEAEAAAARGTGIGCFYDDAVHELLGLGGATWQSLYHFSMGVPVDDARLTTEAGYDWERV